MMTRYCDRRRYIRVPVCGPARWTSGTRQGHCELLDISPGGVGLRMPMRQATQLGPCITLEVDMTPDAAWNLPKNARVVRREPDEDGQCRVGVAFPRDRCLD